MQISQKLIDGHYRNSEFITNEMETVHKEFSSTDLFSKVKLEDGKRQFISTINTDSIDRDFEIVRPRGVNFKNFLRNPVIMLQHQSMEQSAH